MLKHTENLMWNRGGSHSVNEERWDNKMRYLFWVLSICFWIMLFVLVYVKEIARRYPHVVYVFCLTWNIVSPCSGHNLRLKCKIWAALTRDDELMKLVTQSRQWGSVIFSSPLKAVTGDWCPRPQTVICSANERLTKSFILHVLCHVDVLLQL